MSEDTVDYGPLGGLIGVWTGDKGLDVAPEPEDDSKSPYFETLTFTAAGDLTNAEEQKLSMIRYHQVVQRQSDGGVFHDEVGYWMWDAQAQTVMHSLAIPRAVCVLAGGVYTGPKNGEIILNVAAKDGDEDWGIVQSPFMRKKARTVEFRQTLKLTGNTLAYSETSVLAIYGRSFEHTDENTLTRQ